MNLIERTRTFAHEAHKGQLRRDGKTPYIQHVEKVASFFEEGSVAWVVAMLHDTIEDTDVTMGKIAEHFNDFISDAVNVLTHPRYEAYHEYILRIANHPFVIPIKIADIISNLTDSPTKHQKEKYERALKILLAAEV